MLRQDWENHSDPHRMLGCLRGRASDRKLRLFGIACWLGMKEAVTDQTRQALRVVERYADGLVGVEGLWEAFLKLPDVGGRRLAVPRLFGVDDARQVSRWAIAPKEQPPAPPSSVWYYTPPLGGYYQEQEEHGRLLADLFGEPWRPLRFDPAWRTPDVCMLARLAYEESDPLAGALDRARLAILADALEEAGASQRIVDHLRGPGPHVRGCWVVDRCLDKG